MQPTTSCALLSAIYAFTVAAAGSLPRGVGPEFASHYQSKDDFSCITNTAIKLSLSQVNDNTCDCPDGSDEPGTAACAHLDPLSPEQPLPGSASGTTNTTNALPGFWCANEGHIGMYVPFSLVNDGACDYDLCCDGTEEFRGVGGVKCENRCASIGKEYRRVEEERRKNMEKAGNKRRAMAKEAADLRVRVEQRVASLQAEVGALEARKNDLYRKFKEAEEHDRGRVVRGEGAGPGKLGVLVGLAKTRVGELRDTLQQVVNHRDSLQSKLIELEEILAKFKEEYNPNFNDEGVKTAAKSWEEYAARKMTEDSVEPEEADVQSVLQSDDAENGINFAEFEQGDGDDTDVLYSVSAYLPAFARTMVDDSLISLRAWLIKNGIVADNAPPGTESQIVKDARAAFEAAEKELNDKTRSLDGEQDDLAKDHGPGDIFRALKGKKVSIDAGEYTYELHWLDHTAQTSKKGGGSTRMGNFVRIDREMADDEERLDGKSLGRGERMVLRYENGQQCWNGPQRSTEVWLGCAETEELWRVSEAEKCVYKMEVGTPAACDPPAEEKAGQGKDEL